MSPTPGVALRVSAIFPMTSVFQFGIRYDGSAFNQKKEGFLRIVYLLFFGIWCFLLSIGYKAGFKI